MEKKKKIYLMVGLGVVVLSAGAAAWYFSNRKKGGNASADLDFLSQTAASDLRLPEPPKPNRSSSGTTASTTKKKEIQFPIQRGSRGKVVKALQSFLIQKFGKEILPKWGADGIWGSELENALKSKNLPTVITEAIFNRYVTVSGRKAIGLEGLMHSGQLITTRKSRVWNKSGQTITVEANTLLGEPINDTAGVTLFQTLDHRELFINSNNTRYV